MKVSVLVLRTYLKKVSPIDEVGLYKFNFNQNISAQNAFFYSRFEFLIA